MSKVAAFFNSDKKAAIWLTVLISLMIGILIWEAVGWSYNRAFMAPLLGEEFWRGLDGFLGTSFESFFANEEEHPGALPQLYKFSFGDCLIAVFQGKEPTNCEFISAIWHSLQLFATGFVLAILVAVPLGVIFARLVTLRVALESYILILYVTPMIALVPFIQSILGFDFWPKVLVVYLFAFFPMLYNTLEGARSVKPEMIEVAKSFRSSEVAIWRDILIPYTLPYALTGIRQASGRALVGMVAAEIFISTSGLGGELVVASRNANMAGVLGTILVITFLGIIFTRIAQSIEVRFASWRGLDR